MILPAAALATCSAGVRPADPPTAEQTRFFESKVRPVLLASCVTCHSKGRAQGGLSLDGPLSAEKALEVVRRVKGEGGKPQMPQGSKLTSEKIAALEAWVKVGAPWPAGKSMAAPTLAEKGRTHWAFQPVRRPAVPRVRNGAWVHNPVDAFVLSKLEAARLQPNPTASRRDLIRRLSYDLTGLPPTPAEVAAFEADRAPSAYEKLVDRLLASPHYGEKWGRHWLDLVRFAETNSYERDNPKPYVTKYRDYVIRAFNADKPYDQFASEQLAGDEMPNATGDPVLATGYYRLGIWDDEPADKLQAEYDDFDDIITTTGQAFLGLTMDCARCHDHKLDPIPQRDYYRFLAVFHNINRFRNGGATDEARYFVSMDAKRDFEKKAAELEAKRKETLAKIAEAEAKLAAKGPQFYNPGDLSDVSYQYYERDWKRIPEFENEPVTGTGKLTPAFISIKPRQRNEEFAINFSGSLNVAADGEYGFKMASEGGYRLTIGGEKLLESFASDAGPVQKTATKRLKAGKVHFALIFNQRQKQHGLALTWSGPGFASRPLSALESCGQGELPVLLGPERDKLLDAPTAARLAELIDSQATLEKQAPPSEKVLCVTEGGSAPRETKILLRGVPTAEGDKVTAGFPICVSPDVPAVPVVPPGGKSSGQRTAFANWLTSPGNPLTARVIVNRVWQHHFGRGIVRTPNDFGLQGAPPTHPELLDWLASVFAEPAAGGAGAQLATPYACGWSFKKLHRIILTSNAYKQSSRGSQAALEKDPRNDLFWRMDMRRLTAEEIRDSLLAVAGNINLAMFGPSVYPEIPKEILAAQSRPGKDWYSERMTPEDMNRRSIYVSVKRSLVYPLFSSFDLPETDRTAAFRFASTQPTQALGQINGALFNRQAAILAARAQKEAGAEPAAFAKRALSLTLQRSPTDLEIKEAVSLLNRLVKRGAKPEQARTLVCLMALNLDEFLYID